MIRTPRKRGGPSTLTPGDFHLIANRLRAYFAPASIFPPPGVLRGQTGNRNVSVTSQNAPNYTPNDQAVIPLVNGIAVWHFKTPFNNPPVSKATAIGVNLDTHGNPVVAEVYAQGLGTSTSVIFKSSLTTDNRLLFVHAAGNPD